MLKDHHTGAANNAFRLALLLQGKWLIKWPGMPVEVKPKRLDYLTGGQADSFARYGALARPRKP